MSLIKSMLCACLFLGCCAVVSAADAASEMNETLAMAKARGWSAEQIGGLKQFIELRNAGKNQESEAFAKYNDAFIAMLEREEKESAPIDTAALLADIKRAKADAKTKPLAPAEAKKLVETTLAGAKSAGLDEKALAGLAKYLDIALVQGDVDKAAPYESFMTQYSELLAKQTKEANARAEAVDAALKKSQGEKKPEATESSK